MYRIVIIIFLLFCCQIDENDNYYKHSYAEDPRLSDLPNLLDGQWCEPSFCIEFINDEFCCEGLCTDVVTYEQKYFEIAYRTCDMGPIIAFLFRPPYRTISLLTGNEFVIFYKK